MKYIIIACLFIIFLTERSYSQNGYAIGASALYNHYDDRIGVGLRFQIPIKDKFSAIPYIYYYPSSGFFSGGLAGAYYFYSYNRFHFYALVAGTFSATIEVTVNDSTQTSSKSTKANGEAGFGLQYGNRCLRPFLEPRYSVNEKDFNVRLGILYFFQCKGKRGKSGRGGGAAIRRKSKGLCPAYGSYSM